MKLKFVIILLSYLTIHLFSAVFGINYWPLFDYPMYSGTPRFWKKFEVWIEFKDGSHHQLTDKWILWPVGPQGVSSSLMRFYLYQPGKSSDPIFVYFYNRIKKQNLDLASKIHSIYILQNEIIPNDINSPTNVPFIRDKYVFN